ncbi:MAG: HAMP domain-containing protein [Proteobacteria bacterium]|nr:HAMP domain-containing protein [Pseudomonadota bacterium]
MTGSGEGAAPAAGPAARPEQPGPRRDARPPIPRPRRRFNLLRSAAVRFAAIYAVLLSLSVAAAAGFVWWETAGRLSRQIEEAILNDAQALSDHWEVGGVPDVRSAIEERLSQNVDDDAIYMLADPYFERLAGNLSGWPAAVTQPGVEYEIRVERGGIHSLASMQRFDFPGGYHLLVGRDVTLRLQLTRLLTSALFWAVVVVVAVAAVGAIAVRSLFNRMLASVWATTAAISSGDFSRRVQVTGRGDEFDQVAEAINDMLDRITRLMDGVRQVSNAIAHDLRTPIARARTRLEDAMAHAGTEDELRAAIERATADLDAITGVFQALLRIAEIEAGSRRAAFCVFDAAPVLNGVAELYDAVAEDRGLSIAAAVPPSLRVYGDRDMLQQAVANLVDNAVKFSPPGAAVRIAATQSDGWTDIVVTDAGPGIPAADRERAVERFFRGEAARHTPGAGLGLALVQAVAQLHGGALLLEDAAPGLRAVVRLPAADPATAAPAKAAEAAAATAPYGDVIQD